MRQRTTPTAGKGGKIMKRFVLFIIAIAALITGCDNPVIYIFGPTTFPGGVGDVYFYNMEGQTIVVVGDPGDNDFFLREWEAILYPGSWVRVSPDAGPHKFTVQRLIAAQGFQKIYEVPVDVSANSCSAYRLYFGGSRPAGCP